MTNTIPKNIASAVSVKSNGKIVRYKMDCYILHKFLLVIILLFIIVIIWYHYGKQRTKQTNIGTLIKQKIKKNNDRRLF